MKCLQPISVRLRRYYPFAPPKSDNVAYKSWYEYVHSHPECVHVEYREVPCGKCRNCLRRYQNSWAFRIQQEASESACTYFVTLTIDDDHLVFGLRNPTLVKSDVSSFMKVFRQNLCRKVSESDSGVRFFACGEYGDKFGRPHYHLMLFFRDYYGLDFVSEVVSRSWKNGFTKVDSFTLGRSRYVAKYCCKQRGVDYDSEGVQPPFALMSRGSWKKGTAGIGYKFKNKQNARLFSRAGSFLVSDSKGVTQAMPRYYSEYIFSGGERDANALASQVSQFARLDMDEAFNPGDQVRKDLGRINQLNLNLLNGNYQVNKTRFLEVLQESFETRPCESDSLRIDPSGER